jgi:molybdopterin converting factor small subunit
MKIKVLFFASAREAVGGLTELLLDLEPMIEDEDGPAAAADPVAADQDGAAVAPAGGSRSSTTATGGAGGGDISGGTIITTKRLRRELAARYPHLAVTMQSITLAVNEEYVHDDDEDGPVLLSDGDTVALIPPISGG